MDFNNQQMQKLLELADMQFDPCIDYKKQIDSALIEIEKKLNFFLSPDFYDKNARINILIVDDLELSIFQLNKMLNKVGINPYVARTKAEAIDLYNKHSFDFLFIDVYLPNLQDGFDLMNQMLKIKNEKKQKTKFVAISSSDDKDIIQKAMKLGMDKFIIKKQNWHNDIILYIDKEFRHKYEKQFLKREISDTSIIYEFRSLESEKEFFEFLQELETAILNCKKEIYLDLSRINNFDKDFAGFFAQCYKLCFNNNVKIFLLNPHQSVLKALEYAYLDGLIPIIKK